MRSLRPFCVILLIAGLVRSASGAIEDIRRLYDLTPVSSNNPVLVSVKECQVEIPLSEFRAYVNSAFIPGKEGRPMTTAEKREKLDSLLDDYFWIWKGYSEKADETQPDIRGMLAVTRDEAMKALLVEQEADTQVKSLEEYEKLKEEIRQRIFDRADIHISPKAYAALTNAVKSPDATEASLTADDKDQPLVTCKAGAVSTGTFLRAYLSIPADSRPDLTVPTNLVNVLSGFLSDQLLLAEAKERGLDKADVVRTQMQADRTGLVRQWALEQATQKADATMNAPGLEDRLKKWYKAHLKTLYTVKDASGGKRVLDLQKDHDLIQGDYFNDLLERERRQELKKMRAGRKIEVNHKVLDQLVISWPEPHKPAQMPPSLAAWDADTREFVAKAGDTNVVLSFTVTNLSPYDLVIRDIHVVNEFINILSPPLPWTILPGDHGTFQTDTDLRNKKGTGYLPVEVVSSLGSKTLTLKLTYFDGKR